MTRVSEDRTHLITVDTSGLLAALDRRDAHHVAATGVLRSMRGPYVVPVGILAEIGYMIETRLGAVVLDAFLGDLEDGAFLMDCGETDLPRIRELVGRYADLPLGYADAAVIACAERSGGGVLTFDRDLSIVAREGTIRIETGPAT